MNYQDALDYIYSFVDYSRTHMENLAPENFDLDRVRELLEKLGNPHQKYKVIHVAGSKGKGSVVAMCASVLQSAGFKTGMNTSPHLEDFCERMRIDGVEIPQDKVIQLIEEIKPIIDSMEFITTFEIITCLAMLYFAREQADFVCFEVGLGGKLDATNVVDPLVSVITSISLEHTAILGSTLAEIAGEKAGIIKPGVPVISSQQKPEVVGVFQDKANAQNARLAYSSDLYDHQVKKRGLEGQLIGIQNKETGVERIEFVLPLIGAHQAENAVTAYGVIQELIQQGFEIDARNIEDGFRNVSWPGRLEVLSIDPLIIVDGAHNPDSANRLREAIDEFVPDKEIVLIIGFSGDKNLSGILKPLLPITKKVIASQAIHPRAMPPEKIAAQLELLNADYLVEETIESALEAARKNAGKNDLILVTGSLFMVGAAKSAMREKE